MKIFASSIEMDFKIQLHSKFGLIYAKHFSVPNSFAIKDAKNSHFNMAME